MLIAALRRRRTAIENRLAALNSSPLCRWGSGTCRNNGRLIHRARTCLRHHHASRCDHRPRRRSRGLRRLRGRWRLRRRRSCDCRSRRFLRFCRDLQRRSFDNGGRRRWCDRRCGGFRLLVHRRRRYRSRSCGRCNLGRGGLCWCGRLLGGLGRRRSRCGSLGFHNHRGRDNRNRGARGNRCRRGLRYNSSSRRFRRNSGRGRMNDRGGWPGLRHNLPRFRPCRRRRRWSCDRHGRRRGPCRNLRRRRDGSLAGGHLAPACFGFRFLLPGQDGLHYVPGLGNVRQINLRGNGPLSRT